MSRIVAVVFLATFAACLLPETDVASVTQQTTFVVRGKAMTGAHTRAPLAGATVGLVSPSKLGRVQLRFPTNSKVPNKVLTAADGSFTFRITTDALTYATHYPMFIGVTDAAQTFTMLAQIPYDRVSPDADLALDVTPTTTAASVLICPGGVYPPPSGSYCYEDPKNTRATSTAIEGAIDTSLGGTNIALETGSRPTWADFIAALLADARLFDQLLMITTNAGLTSPGFTVEGISKAFVAITQLTPPVPSDANNGGAVSSSSGSSGTTSACVLHWDCGGSAQCAAAFGAPTGNAPDISPADCKSYLRDHCPGGACSCVGCD